MATTISRPTSHWQIGDALRAVLWATVVALACYFVVKNALHYLAPRGAQRANQGSYPALIRLHIVAGMSALFGGLVQFSTGLRGTHRTLHRWLGRAYLTSIAVSVTAVALLLPHSTGGLVFVSSMVGLAVSWVGTSTLAWLAIRRGRVAQHREWMVRSYVVTFAFVSFRILFDALTALHIGTRAERSGLSGWFCWAVPLLFAEFAIQGGKVMRAPSRDTSEA